MNDFICKKCGAAHNFFLKEKEVGTGIATGLHCAYCNAWQKWVGAKELKILIPEAVAYETIQKQQVSQEEKTIDERIEELRKTIVALQDLKARFVAVRAEKEKKKAEEENNSMQTFVLNLEDLPPVEENDNPPWD